jgi:hypothetical protein
MSLEKDINDFKAQIMKDVPEEMLKTMETAGKHLEQSGIVDKNLKVGDRAPSFTLPNVTGEPTSSATVLTKGPLVVSFYRGGW